MEDIEFNIQKGEDLPQMLQNIEERLLEDYRKSGQSITKYIIEKIHDDVINLFIDGYFDRAFENGEKITMSSIHEYIRQDKEEKTLRRRELGIGRDPNTNVANFSLNENWIEDEEFTIEYATQEDEEMVVGRKADAKVKAKPDNQEYWSKDPERIEILKEELNNKSQSNQEIFKQSLTLFPRIMQKIIALPDKELDIFCALYFLSENYLDCMADQTPSEWNKENWEGKLIARCSGLSVEYKKIFLRYQYMPLNFWQEYFYQSSLKGPNEKEPLLNRDLSYNSWKEMKEKYEKYSKSLTQNISRKCETIVDKLLAEFPQENKTLLKILRFELLFSKGHTTFDQPKHNITLHDEILSKGKDIKCCKKYLEIIPLFVIDKIFKNNLHEKHPLWEEYKKHRMLCKDKCQRYECYLEKTMIFRYSRIQEDILRAMQFFYPAHKPEENNLPMNDVKTAIKHYKESYKKKPSDLYETYLDILYKRDGKPDGFKPTAKSQKEQANRGSKLGYELETHCLCGDVHRYKLNALRFPKVIVGSNQGINDQYPHIYLCQDDKRCQDDKIFLKQNMIYFIYDQGEWKVGTEQKNGVYYLSKEDIFNWLRDHQGASGDPKKIKFPGKYYWNDLSEETNPKELSSIIGIGIKFDDTLEFRGKSCSGVCHPILGKLNGIGWFIEINNNRSTGSIIDSVISKSVY